MSDLKADLRVFLKKKREEISQARRDEAKIKVMDELYGRLAPYRKILSFASMGDEIDLWELNEALSKEGRLLLPHMEGDDLIPRAVFDFNDLKRSSFNILQPMTGKAVKKLDCILVPAIGFDRAKHRIGYGKGHYDRFLSEITDVVTIGVGFKEQLTSDHLPIGDHDISLTEILLF